MKPSLFSRREKLLLGLLCSSMVFSLSFSFSYGAVNQTKVDSIMKMISDAGAKFSDVIASGQSKSERTLYYEKVDAGLGDAVEMLAVVRNKIRSDFLGLSPAYTADEIVGAIIGGVIGSPGTGGGNPGGSTGTIISSCARTGCNTSSTGGTSGVWRAVSVDYRGLDWRNYPVTRINPYTVSSVNPGGFQYGGSGAYNLIDFRNPSNTSLPASCVPGTYFVKKEESRSGYGKIYRCELPTPSYCKIDPPSARDASVVGSLDGNKILGPEVIGHYKSEVDSRYTYTNLQSGSPKFWYEYDMGAQGKPTTYYDFSNIKNDQSFSFEYIPSTDASKKGQYMLINGLYLTPSSWDLVYEVAVSSRPSDFSSQNVIMKTLYYSAYPVANRGYYSGPGVSSAAKPGTPADYEQIMLPQYYPHKLYINVRLSRIRVDVPSNIGSTDESLYNLAAQHYLSPSEYKQKYGPALYGGAGLNAPKRTVTAGLGDNMDGSIILTPVFHSRSEDPLSVTRVNPLVGESSQYYNYVYAPCLDGISEEKGVLVTETEPSEQRKLTPLFSNPYDLKAVIASGGEITGQMSVYLPTKSRAQ